MNNNHIKNNLLPISLVVSVIIFSGAVLAAGGTIGESLSQLTMAIEENQITISPGGAGSGALAPSPNTVPQAPAPTKGGIEISGLLEGASATLGDPNAEVVIVEYSDYQCPFCRKFFNDTKSQLDNEYIETGKVFFIYKDFPLNFHPMAQSYAEAARCAGDQGKYWEMHDTIFEEQNKFGSGTISNLTESDVKNWAEKIGIDTAEFDSCLDSGKYSQAVSANFSEGSQIGVSGTPSFVVGKANGTGRLIVGAQPYGVFKTAIDGLLE
jgi:protein-disulfide isomerase